MSLRPTVNLYQDRGHVLETAPATEPVTADELRTQLRETATGLPDAEANDLITEARQLIEENTGLALITQSWIMALDRWPSGQEQWWSGTRQGAISELAGPVRQLELPRYPLRSLTSVTVYNDAGTPSVVDISATFDVDVYRKPGRMALKNGATWPIALRSTNAIVIVYESGYGAASDVPAALKRAVKQAAAYLYTNRGDACCAADALSAVSSMLMQYRVARI
tara:strand:- start:3748 stop:4416 length:669 start_codon:yes stop_codon:yes gene_type:complete